MTSKLVSRRSTFHALGAVYVAAALFAAPVSSFAADAPAPPPKAIKVIILPVINASQDLSAKKIMDDILREQLRTVPPERATFLLPFDSERILAQRNALDRSYRLSDKWDKYGAIDTTAVAGIDSIVT